MGSRRIKMLTHGRRPSLSISLNSSAYDNYCDLQDIYQYLIPKYKMGLAKALFDNVAETPDELAFRRGDVLNILHNNVVGLDGWWLCSLRGKKGIAPANRLQPIATTMQLPDNQVMHRPAGMTDKNWNRRSWDICPDKVMTPQKLGEIYVYVQPDQSMEDYDVPPSRYFPSDGSAGSAPVKSKSLDHGVGMLSISPNMSLTNESLNSSGSNLSLQNDIYDVPPSQNASFDMSQGPPSNRSSMHSMLSTGSTATMSSSLSNQSLPQVSAPPSSCGSARSSLDIASQDIYDIPPAARGVGTTAGDDSSLNSSDLNLNVSNLDEIYDTPPCSRCITADGDDETYSTPAKPFPIAGTDDVYDVPPAQRSQDLHIVSDSGLPEDTYDTPPRRSSVEHVIDELYDVPPSLVKPALLNKGTKAENGQCVDNVDGVGVYDIPPQVTRDGGEEVTLDDSLSRLSSCSVDSRGSDVPTIPYNHLNLDLDSAMERLVKLQQDVHSSASKFLSFISSTWRQRETLEPKLYDIKISCTKVISCLHEFVEFAEGTLANSGKAEDKKLVQKLVRQLEPLQDYWQRMSKSLKNLDEIKWSLDVLVVSASVPMDTSDDLGIIAETVKEVPNHVRTMATLIQGNSTLLFQRAETIQDKGRSGPLASSTPQKAPPTISLLRHHSGQNVPRQGSIQERPLPPVPKPKARPLSKVDGTAIYEVPKEKDGTPYDQKDQAIIDEYDYVHLENRLRAQKEKNKQDGSKDSASGHNDIARTSIGLSSKFKERLEEVQSHSPQRLHQRSSSTTRVRSMLHDNDKQLLVFYAAQINQQNHLLLSSADAFFQCIEMNQPPKVFVAHSKFVILGAHKMVYIGDTLHRNILSEDVRSKITVCANCLCNCLKHSVVATKNAALQFPAVVSVQEMVDRISDVMRAANELKLVITQAAHL